MYHPLFLQSVENERQRPAQTLRAFVSYSILLAKGRHSCQGTVLVVTFLPPSDGTSKYRLYNRLFTWKLASQEVPLYLLFLQLLDEALLLEAQQDDVDVGLEGGPRSHADAVSQNLYSQMIGDTLRLRGSNMMFGGGIRRGCRRREKNKTKKANANQHYFFPSHHPPTVAPPILCCVLVSLVSSVGASVMSNVADWHDMHKYLSAADQRVWCGGDL